MKPIGPLMKEHRVIDRMIALMVTEDHRIEQAREVDSTFIAAVIDFFRTYVDRTHHTKEEDFLFETLESKQLTPELRQIMRELYDEHALARAIIEDLDDALKSHDTGDDKAGRDISGSLKHMIDLYPKHIEKEDKRFFFPAQGYLSQEEQDSMLRQMWEYDRNIIHEKYNRVVDEMHARLAASSPV